MFKKTTSTLCCTLVLLLIFTLCICGELQIVSRQEWGAQPAKNELTKLVLPIERVIITHTASAECNEEERCIQILRAIQQFQTQSSGFDDIAYNFLVGNDGHVYEGRGWEQQGAFARGFNAGSLGLAFIGNFNATTPTEKALEAAQTLIAHGVQLEKLSKDYKLMGHRQLMATNSPGDALYAVIKQWPNWSRK